MGIGVIWGVFFEPGESERLTNMGASCMKRLIPEAAISIWNVESGNFKRGSKQAVSGIYRRIKLNVILQLQIGWS